jgi:hypothetical protein
MLLTRYDRSRHAPLSALTVNLSLFFFFAAAETHVHHARRQRAEKAGGGKREEGSRSVN